MWVRGVILDFVLCWERFIPFLCLHIVILVIQKQPFVFLLSERKKINKKNSKRSCVWERERAFKILHFNCMLGGASTMMNLLIRVYIMLDKQNIQNCLLLVLLLLLTLFCLLLFIQNKKPLISFGMICCWDVIDMLLYLYAIHETIFLFCFFKLLIYILSFIWFV